METSLSISCSSPNLNALSRALLCSVCVHCQIHQLQAVSLSLFLVCCGLAASWLNSVVSSAFTRQHKSRTCISKSQFVASSGVWDSVGIFFHDSASVFLLLCSCSPQMATTVTALKDVMCCAQRSGTAWAQCEWRARAKVTESLLRGLCQSKTGLQRSVMSFSEITLTVCRSPLNKAHLKGLTISETITGTLSASFCCKRYIQITSSYTSCGPSWRHWSRDYQLSPTPCSHLGKSR